MSASVKFGTPVKEVWPVSDPNPDSADQVRLTPVKSAPELLVSVIVCVVGTDGVSLQSQELTGELRRRGWTVRPCASDVPDGAGGLRLDELAYQSGDAVSLRRRVFTSTVADSDSSALGAPCSCV